MNHYHVLGLPPPGSRSNQKTVPSDEQVKQAYRTALLQYHPDKVGSLGTSDPRDTGALSRKLSKSSVHCDFDDKAPTIDEIKAAYLVLSDASSRAAYDRELILKSSASLGLNGSTTSSRLTGGEVVDLDDMVLDDTSSSVLIWTRSCRCGQDRGFEVRETQLDAAVAKGEKEVVLGCHGCSLWMRVTFDLADDNPSET